MNRRDVPDDLKLIIDNMLYDAAKDPENLASIAGQLLSDLTGFPAIMATVTKDEAYVGRVEILPMGSKTVLLLLITSDGLARSRICRSAFSLSPEVLVQFDRLVSVNIIGTSLSEFTPYFLQTLVAKNSSLALFITPLLSSIFEMVEELQSKTIRIKGESNLMKCYSNEYDARAILELFTRQELLFSLLAGTRQRTEVVFGDKTGIDELKPSNIVVAKYDIGGEDIGRIGVVGPTRMAYEQLIPSLEYFAGRLGAVMNQAIRDLDENY
jgi:heat-inducible transcriptional repressor